MAPPRSACGSSRCACDHAGCDLGWITVHLVDPTTGRVREASEKCDGCFPHAVQVAPEKERAEDRRGETYPDLRSRAVGQ